MGMRTGGSGASGRVTQKERERERQRECARDPPQAAGGSGATGRQRPLVALIYLALNRGRPEQREGREHPLNRGRQRTLVIYLVLMYPATPIGAEGGEGGREGWSFKPKPYAVPLGTLIHRTHTPGCPLGVRYGVCTIPLGVLWVYGMGYTPYPWVSSGCMVWGIHLNRGI